jgi:6-pyruvoyltetrahydropterin/6-carboxytetrahydropterin synthase
MIAKRYHDISCGHKVYGHESKCAYLHGHNYRIHFEIQGNIDSIGRVLDFSVIKKKLCNWLEENFDHRFLVYENDPDALKLQAIDATVFILNFNPTAENIAKYLVEEIAPIQLKGTGCKLIKCEVEETRKCSAIYESK